MAFDGGTVRDIRPSARRLLGAYLCRHYWSLNRAVFHAVFVAGLFIFFALTASVKCALHSGKEQHHRFVVRRQLSTIPAGFSLHRRAVLPDEVLDLSLALPQANIDGLHSALLEISDPQSEKYGQHLSKAEVEALVSPSPESVQAVTKWLEKNDISIAKTSPTSDMIHIQIPRTLANELFDANFTTYLHEATNTIISRTLSYSLPEHLQGHVLFIYPTTHFTPPSLSFKPTPVKAARPYAARAQAGSPPASCATDFTPQCVQGLYNIPTAPAVAPNNNIFVSGLGGDVSNAEDLQTFLSQFRPDVKDAQFGLFSVDGGSDDGDGTSEGNFDIQYTVGLATNVPVTYVSAGNTSQVIIDDLLDQAKFLLSQDQTPLVLSTSYVFEETSSSPDIFERICSAYAQLGARGTSVIFASGDGGVAGAGFGGDPSSCEYGFVPTFPSTCPYVTSVGATQGLTPEAAAPFSSGGFSNLFPRPDYQAVEVLRYLNNTDPTYVARFNASGRAFPDVAAHGTDYLFIIGGKKVALLGTSAAAPTFASIVALLNDRLLQAGKPPLGFLNPMLYGLAQNASAFNDITSGSNPGCGTDGFAASVGWDPVTGLGTPDFDKLLAALTGTTVNVKTLMDLRRTLLLGCVSLLPCR